MPVSQSGFQQCELKYSSVITACSVRKCKTVLLLILEIRNFKATRDLKKDLMKRLCQGDPENPVKWMRQLGSCTHLSTATSAVGRIWQSRGCDWGNRASLQEHYSALMKCAACRVTGSGWLTTHTSEEMCAGLHPSWAGMGMAGRRPVIDVIIGHSKWGKGYRDEGTNLTNIWTSLQVKLLPEKYVFLFFLMFLYFFIETAHLATG